MLLSVPSPTPSLPLNSLLEGNPVRREGRREGGEREGGGSGEGRGKEGREGGGRKVGKEVGRQEGREGGRKGERGGREESTWIPHLIFNHILFSKSNDELSPLLWDGSTWDQLPLELFLCSSLYLSPAPLHPPNCTASTTHTITHRHMHTHTHTHMHTHTHTCIHTHAHAHACTHTHQYRW